MVPYPVPNPSKGVKQATLRESAATQEDPQEEGRHAKPVSELALVQLLVRVESRRFQTIPAGGYPRSEF